MALTKVSYSMIAGAPVNIVDFGAVSGQDSTAAITAAEAAAFALGTEMYFPTGEYIFEGQLNCRVDIVGYGATIKQKKTSDTLDAVIKYSLIDNITVRGLTIDGNNVSRGLLFDGCDNIKINDVFVKNVGFGAIALYLGDNIEVSNCFTDGCKYITIASVVQTAADGFLFASCVNVRVSNCYAKNFQRIGFVAEGTLTEKSRFVKYSNCHASDASNSDATATEYNAGFWHENSHNVSYANCSALNIATNVNQTNNRVIGFVGGGEESVVCVHNYVNCYVDNDTYNIFEGFRLNGASKLPSFYLVNCGVRTCVNGITSTGGIETISIINFRIALLNASASAISGGLFFDTSVKGLSFLNVENLNISSGSYNVDSADINFFTSDINTRYVLSNAGDIKHVMRQPCASITVTDTRVQYGSATFGSFAALQIKFGENFVGYVRTGATRTQLITEIVGTSSVYFDNNAELTSFTNTYNMVQLSGTGVNLFANGAKFSWTGFEINILGTFNHQFSNCFVTKIPPTTGFYKSNFSSPTSQTLMATGNRFISDSAADTAFIKWNFNPTNSVFQANTYTATNLYTFDAGVTQANNTNV